MLVSATAAAKNLAANNEAFGKDYSIWTEERVHNFMEEIDDVSVLIGVKPATTLRDATKRVKRIGKNVIEDATVIIKQMKRGYRKEPEKLNERMQLFGFSKCWAKAKRGGQAAQLDLVLTFTNNMNEKLKSELIEYGVAAHRIESMKSYASDLMDANVEQETLKGAAPVITSDMIKRLNEIYDTAIDICEAGKTVFSKDPARKALFSFNKLVAQQVAASKPKPSDGEDNVDTDPGTPETDSAPTE
jgi:hypothetical protein